jgi:hypothetical protein
MTTRSSTMTHVYNHPLLLLWVYRLQYTFRPNPEPRLLRATFTHAQTIKLIDKHFENYAFTCSLDHKVVVIR